MVSSSEILDARILIVDDQPANIKLLKLILDREGYTSVASTTDSREVCALHRERNFDLILLDLLMPDMYGFQVIEGLRQIEGEGDLPVLVISAQPDYKLRAMQAGAKEFIAKPISSAEVATQVHGMLHARLSGAAYAGTTLEHEFQERSAGLRNSEELFRHVATCLPDALWIREVNGELIRYINPAWEAITGQRLVAGDRSEKLFAALHPQDMQRVRLDSGGLRSGGVDLKCRIVRPDATVRRVRVRTFLIRDAAQKIVQVAGVMQDITKVNPAASGIA